MGVENSKLKSPEWQDAQEIYFFFCHPLNWISFCAWLLISGAVNGVIYFASCNYFWSFIFLPIRSLAKAGDHVIPNNIPNNEMAHSGLWCSPPGHWAFDYYSIIITVFGILQKLALYCKKGTLQYYSAGPIHHKLGITPLMEAVNWDFN